MRRSPSRGLRQFPVVLAAALLAVGAGGCGVFRASGPEGRELADGHRRLAPDVSPRHYSLSLEIDPAAEFFRGSVRIDVEIAGALRIIALHAEGLRIAEAYAVLDGERRSLVVRAGRNGGIALVADSPLRAGVASLHLRFDGPLGEVPRGLYRVKDGDAERGGTRWYAFTQFEPLSARRAFPSFDQPEFKTPFDVTLRVPAGLVALSNAPEVSRVREGESEVFRFAETRPLPTYLVAFAVGDFEFAEVPGTSVDTRIVTARGKIDLARFSARRTPAILSWLEGYFGRAYPFAKLDLVAVPNFSAGAMENVGLVTFRESILLVDDAAPVWDRARAETIIAHELAHMWYGNLVTMPWWDDLWLNEGFASWMASKAIADLVPAYELPLESVARAQHIMTLDSKRDARSVRQPILSAGDVYNAFDGITYGKGSALLRMLETWLGEDVFRRSVQSYMRTHAYGSGSTADLMAILGEVSGLPVGETIQTFLDQPGTPVVEVLMTCEEGRPAELDLMQQRYLPAGSSAAQGKTWAIPMCVRYGLDERSSPKSYRECFVFDEAVGVQRLGETGCPTWLHPNAGEAGYYRWSIDPSGLRALVGPSRDALSVSERVALPGHLWALLSAEKLSLEDYANGLVELAGAQHRSVVKGVAQGLSALDHAAVDDAMRPAFASQVRSLLGPHLDRIGLLPVEGESVDAELLRSSLVSRLADFGQDLRIQEMAEVVAQRFLAGFGSQSELDLEPVSEAAVDLFLSSAASHGDAALWHALVEALAQGPSPGLRSAIVRALGSFREPALLESSLDLLIDGTLRSQDHRTLLASVDDETRPIAWEWLRLRYDALVDKIGPMSVPRLPGLASGFCSEERSAEVRAFFTNAKRAPPGTARNLGLAVESIERCVRLRAAIREPLREWLAGAAAGVAAGVAD